MARKTEADRRKELQDKIDTAKKRLQKLDSDTASKVRKAHQRRSFVIGDAVQFHLGKGGKLDLGPILEAYLDDQAQRSLAKAKSAREAVVDLLPSPRNYETLRAAAK